MVKCTSWFEGPETKYITTNQINVDHIFDLAIFFPVSSVVGVAGYPVEMECNVQPTKRDDQGRHSMKILKTFF